MKKTVKLNVFENIKYEDSVVLPYFNDGLPWIKNYDEEGMSMSELATELIEVPQKIAKDADYVVRALDNSMLDLNIKKNGLIFVAQTNKIHRDNQITMTIHHHHGTLCRRVTENSNKTYTLTPCADGYKVETVDANDLKIAGEVTGVFHNLKGK